MEHIDKLLHALRANGKGHLATPLSLSQFVLLSSNLITGFLLSLWSMCVYVCVITLRLHVTKIPSEANLLTRNKRASTTVQQFGNSGLTECP